MRIKLALVGAILVFGSIFAIVGSEDMKVQTNSGEPLEAEIYLDGKEAGFSDKGVVSVNSEDLKKSERIRIQGTVNGLSYDVSYPVSKINFTEEGPVLEIPAKRVAYHKMHFYIEPTNESLEGIVFNNGRRVGLVQNGSLYVSPEDLEYGNLRLNGTYNGSNFSLSYSYDSSLASSRQIDYYVEDEELRSVVFDARDLSRSEIEEAVLDYVNDIRNGERVPPPASSPRDSVLSNFTVPELEPLPELDVVKDTGEEVFVRYDMPDYLEMNEQLRADARDKSQEMRESSYFSHESPSGEDYSDRLKSREIFFVTGGENLHKTGDIPYYWDEDDVARSIVRGWEGSPGHRSLMVDRDRMYSHAGVGVSCTKNSCYATLVTAQMVRVVNTYLEDNYCSYSYINDPGWGLNYHTDVSIEAKVDGSVDAHLVDKGKHEFGECVDSDRIESFKEFEDTDGFQYDYGNVDQGDAIVISTNEGSNITVKMDYTRNP